MFEDHENAVNLEDVRSTIEHLSNQVAEMHETLNEIKIALYILVAIAVAILVHAYNTGWFS